MDDVVDDVGLTSDSIALSGLSITDDDVLPRLSELSDGERDAGFSVDWKRFIIPLLNAWNCAEILRPFRALLADICCCCWICCSSTVLVLPSLDDVTRWLVT